MKLNLDRNAKIKIFLIVALIIAAPYFAPFAIDFIVLADFMGLEAFLILIFAYSKSAVNVAGLQLAEIRGNIGATVRLVADLPIFRPGIYFTHATASTLLASLPALSFLRA